MAKNSKVDATSADYARACANGATTAAVAEALGVTAERAKESLRFLRKINAVRDVDGLWFAVSQ